MPNWVSNGLTLSGDPQLVKEVKERLAAPTPIRTEEQQNEFSFWNIVAPADIDRYQMTVGSNDMDNYNHQDNWYNWNNRNWGCKWDASGVSRHENEDGTVYYEFETPWSPPLEVIEKLSEQYPSLKINLRFTEEQGWGGIVEFLDGEQEVLDEWDIPETHAEALKVWGECGNCHYSGDEAEYRYDDCPPLEVAS